MTAEDQQDEVQHPTALQLLSRLRSGELTSQEIGAHERRVCVAYLRLEGYTQEEIAQIFGVHRQTILRDERAIREQTGRLVDELDVRWIAGELIALAEHLKAKALKEKDYALAWKIQRELVSDLQSLGYLPKAVEQHQVQIGTFVELAKLAAQEGSALESAPQKALAEATDAGADQSHDSTDEATEN